METVIDSPRTFQLWRAVVSHSQVLFRSTKADDYRTRVEILFKSVFATKLLTTMRGINVREGDRSELTRVLVECSVPTINPELRVFMLSDANGFEGWVVAGAVTVHEDDGEYDEPSALL